MTDETHDYRCTVTLLLDDVTANEAQLLLADGAEVRDDYGTVAMIENPGKIEVQP